MKTILYYYTGTGNSLWAARRMAEELGDSQLLPVISGALLDVERVGLVFPVHIWGLPGRVIEFIEKTHLNPDAYYFALAVNGGEVARTLIQLSELLAKKGIKLNAGIDVPMVSNYIPWGGPGPEAKIKAALDKADGIIQKAAEYIKTGAKGRIDKGPLWQRIIYTGIYNSSAKYVNYMDKSFRVDEKCNGCGICEKVCPAHNISMENDRPKWNKRCEQCFACLQWCPQEAIQYGKKTPKYERYRNPYVKLSEMMVGRLVKTEA